MGVIDFIEGHQAEFLEDLKEFLRFPSISTREEHRPDIARAAEWLGVKLRSAGMQNIEIIPTDMHPIV